MKKSLLILVNALVILNSCSADDDSAVTVQPIEGKTITLNEGQGDPAEINQFWIELTTGNVTKTHRENWDLGFYSGNEFRVVLNSSLQMSVGKIENAYDIDQVNSETVASLKPLVQIGNYLSNSEYVDDPTGDIVNQTTAISGIKANEAENNVYLLNLGHKTYSGTMTTGSVYTKGDTRGYKKIKIIRNQQGYKIQYADLDDTTHKEYTIAKDNAYNYQFFSFNTNQNTFIQPKKNNWDISFSVFTNVIPAGTHLTSYVYPDFILTNTLGNVAAYEIVTEAGQGETAYNEFKLSNVEHSKFIVNDQRVIGGNWRTTTGTNGPEVYSNKFYVIRNNNGSYFKLRFLRMKDDNGNRGYPQFEYKTL